MKKGDKIICVDPIEGYLTRGKEYESQGIESYAGRVVVTDDNGREGHFKPERFVQNMGVNLEKQKAKIDNWIIVKHPFYNDHVLQGKIVDHPRQTDFHTDVQVTSKLLSIDFVNKKAETQNTSYELLSEYKGDEI